MNLVTKFFLMSIAVFGASTINAMHAPAKEEKGCGVPRQAERPALQQALQKLDADFAQLEAEWAELRSRRNMLGGSLDKEFAHMKECAMKMAVAEARGDGLRRSLNDDQQLLVQRDQLLNEFINCGLAANLASAKIIYDNFFAKAE